MEATTPVSSPPPLAGASLAYDAKTATVVLFGGSLGSNGQGFSNETWAWDGLTWTQQFPPVSPSARNWNSPNGMVFDAVAGKVVLFGGGTSTTSFGDTWEWDGLSKTWTQKYPVHNPSPRAATLAYDEAANQVVLFGGNAVGYHYYQDTWTYNGVDWVQHESPTIPPARSDNALAYDPILKRVVLFGGLAGPCEDCGEQRLNDTWAWGGVDWTQVQTPLTPAPSSGASFTYDATTRSMLLFGGWVTDFQFASSTWFLHLF
jgi:hypothetical protein